MCHIKPYKHIKSVILVSLIYYNIFIQYLELYFIFFILVKVVLILLQFLFLYFEFYLVIFCFHFNFSKSFSNFVEILSFLLVCLYSFFF